MKDKIIASTRCRANGWQATLEFPNGGIQAFSSIHYSHDAALKTAKELLNIRLNYPKSCVIDPQPNLLMEL
jgi:hypothetical protein